jgi:hypothetical protein
MKISSKTITWLLEENNPSVRYLTLRDIKQVSSTNPQLKKAKQASYANGAIAKVLKNMKPEGYWFKPGHGYSPKYKGTVWSLIALSQLGANVEDDERVETACKYYLDNGLCEGGKFTSNGSPSGTIDCLQGNMCAALKEMGCEDPRLDGAYDWLAHSITGNGVKQYYSYKCGPKFACGVNAGKACAWGAVKTMLALSKIPPKKKTSEMKKAVKIGVDFLFSVDPALATYPTKDGAKPSRNWWKLGFPVFYIADILQIIEVLTALGYGKDKRLKNAIDLIYQKQDKNGRWALEYNYQTWYDFGKKKDPNKWVTYRVVKVLQKL